MPTSAQTSLQPLDSLVDLVSGQTGLSKDQIALELVEAGVNTYQYQGKALVSPNDFVAIIDAWATSIKMGLRNGKAVPTAPVSSASKVVDRTNAAEVVPETVPEKDTSSLNWPQGYEAFVTHLYSPTLNKILPQDPDQKREYLEAIAQETEAGQRLLNELATTIVQRSKRNLAFNNVLEGLKRKIVEMAAA